MMLKRMAALVCAQLLLLGSASAAAQTPVASRLDSLLRRDGPMPVYGTLRGTIADRATRAPLPGFGVAEALLWAPRSDSLGRYTSRVRSGLHWVRVFCPSRTWTHVQTLDSVRVRISPDSTTVLHLLVNPASCTEPPLDSVDAEFVGHFSTGFEENRFVPCPGSLAAVPGGVLYGENLAWVRFDSAAAGTGPRTRPAPDTSGYGDRYFVRWRGRLVGPGNYGHMGISPYLLTVYRILDIRTPAPGDCGP